MSSTPTGARQRGSKNQKSTVPAESNGHANGASVNPQEVLDQLKKVGKETVRRDWDYKLAFAIITGLAFLTRFWGISHPNEVVFDEVHFGKVSHSLDQDSRQPLCNAEY